MLCSGPAGHSGSGICNPRRGSLKGTARPERTLPAAAGRAQDEQMKTPWPQVDLVAVF